jgi:hypothetical protein
MTKILRLALLSALLAATTLSAQSIYGTLTGVVTDPAQAVVPNARVIITNTASGDVRRTVTNSDGFFTFASVSVATYDLTVEATGFSIYKVTGIALTGAERRNIDVVLKVGSTSETVEVTGVAEQLVTLDSGQKDATLTTKQLQDFSVVGRSAAEFIKIMPGFSIANTGTENRSNFSGEVIGINGNGEGGSQSALNNAYSVNGLPGSSLDITADGAHVSDPGCNCATPVNPNTDMIQEFKVLTSNFSAENQKGPAVISSVAKAGGRDFHGSGYLYARHYSMNSNDWLNNRQGFDPITGTELAPRPQNKYFFPGGNVGGPVLIPGTRFNKNRDKMFFFTGYEHYFQTIDTGLLRATVPTEGMMAGNFSESELRKIEGLVQGTHITSSGGPAQRLNSAEFPTGIIPTSLIDPGGLAMMKLLPRPNADPNATAGFNYVKQIVFDQNSLQWMSRVDYNFTDMTKLFVRYNLQAEQQMFPVGLWWRNANQVPYPTEIVGKNRSHSVTASLTHVFNPTLTNEFIFGYTFIGFPNVFNDPEKVQRANVGYPYQGLFKNGVTQIPSFTGWGGEIATLLNPGGFEVGGARGLFADKYLPTISNNMTKVWSTHTLKFGGFWEYIINSQPANNYTNGLMVLSNWGNGTTGSSYGDLLTGRLTQYQEQNFNRLNNIGYNTVEFFGQDSWKATRRLTLELGLRVSHFQPWQDREGFGYSIFDYSRYNPAAPPTDYSGFVWNKRDPNVPLSGFPTRTAFWAPRFGAAYDLFGTGNTVLRGGWGRFYFHSAQFTAGLDASAGVRSISFNEGTTLRAIEATTPGLGDRLGVQAVDSTSDRSPYSDSYSFTLSQRLPFSSLLEVAYVGNRSRHLLNTGGPGNNFNAVPAGALLRPGVGNPNDANLDSFRPLAGFQDVRIATHNLYSNYNSMQVSWIRTKGRYNLNLNYTWGKSMGITGTGDEFNLANNYGPTAADRRHVFNSAYSIEMGNPVRNNMIGRGLLNGWQFSGITQWQSGINLTANTGGNFGLDTNGNNLANGYAITARSVSGTDMIGLRPMITCDPRSGLGPNQFVNGNCYKLPTQPGQNGPTIGPAVYGPAFFNSDLGLFKNFQISESKKLQFRFNAYNFLNHPLWSFINTSSNLKLQFAQNNPSAIANPQFGVATEKQGRRIIQLALKFFF